MDTLDVKIFCEMAFKDLSYDSFSDRHVSASAIGRKLGLDEKTVRVRIKRMEEEGFVKYYQGVPSFALFGLRSVSTFRFRVLNLATKLRLLDHIRRAPGVVEALDYLGPVVSITLAGKSSDENLAVADKIASRFELTRLHVGHHLVREPRSNPDRLDWRIIRELRYDARRTSRDIAGALSITSRMVDYRIAKLLDSGALSFRAMIDAQRQEGVIFYELESSVRQVNQVSFLSRLKEIYGEKLWSMSKSSDEVLLIKFFCFALNEPEKTEAELMGFDGVRRCSLFILKETIEPDRPNWIDTAIEQKIANFV